MTDRFDEEALRNRGFRGFVTFSSLNLLAVPRGPGVYVVLRGDSVRHDVMDTSAGGWFKAKDPTADPELVRSRLRPASQTLYIGKADAGKNGRRGLRRRIDEFARFGRGIPKAHWGGRYLWQLSNSQLLRIAWLPVPDKPAARMEAALFDEFFDVHGQLPFANLRR